MRQCEGIYKHLLKDIGLRRMGHNKWRGVFLDILVFASEL